MRLPLQIVSRLRTLPKPRDLVRADPRPSRLTSVLLCAGILAAQTQPADNEWPVYGHDSGGTKYSPLDQINRQNVNHLKVAWTYHTLDMYQGGSAGLRGRKSAFETTPIYVDGTLFATTAFGRVIALDPQTGTARWQFDPKSDTQAGYGDFANRGVATWKDTKTGERRIYIATIDTRLFAIDAKTGQPCPDFGDKGHVDLRRGLRIPPRAKDEYEETSPPAVIGDVVVVGSAVADNGRTDMPSGEVRAFDARSGKLRWTWDPMPNTRTGAANAWSIIVVDPERGLVFVPTGSASPDYFGGERKGNGLYANAIVALEAETGKLKWAFQTIHHDLWDYDVAAPPALVTVKGKAAVAVGPKSGYLFLLDRETGKPIFGVDEKAVPKSDVEGEESSPTQPVPVLPKHLGPEKFSPWGASAEEQKWCEETLSKLRYDGMFTPPSLQGSLLFPGNVGGMAWGGVAFDPRNGLLIVPNNRLAAVARLIPRDQIEEARKARPDWETAEQRGTPYGMQRRFLLGPKGLPCTAPPWGVLTAIDANSGEVKWEVPTGEITFAPSKPEWGSPSLGGPIVTAGGLVFLGATFDPYLKAYDIETGKLLWKGEMPTSARATPMTYRGPDGKQYVVIAAGGHDVPGAKQSDALIAWRLD